MDKFSVVFAITLVAVFLLGRLPRHQLTGGGLIVIGTIVLAWR